MQEEPNPDDVVNDQFFAPGIPPQFDLLVSVDELTGEGNWPPQDWRTAVCGVNHSVEAFCQWLGYFAGHNGVLRLTSGGSLPRDCVNDAAIWLGILRQRGEVPGDLKLDVDRLDRRTVSTGLIRLLERISSLDPSSGRNPATTGSDNIFRRQNDTWVIRFRGGPIQQGIANAKAAKDVQYLLERPGEEIKIEDLPGNEGVKVQTSCTPVATKEDFEMLLKQIVERKEALRTEHDEWQKQEIEKEIKALQKQQDENFDKLGNPREIAGDIQRIKKATQTRVNRFCNEKISPILPEFASHLLKHLSVGEICSYKPDDDIVWDTGKSSHPHRLSP